MYSKRHQRLIKEISKELGVNERVVEVVVRHSLTFTAGVIRDPKDETPIRLPYWGVYTLRKGKHKPANIEIV